MIKTSRIPAILIVVVAMLTSPVAYARGTPDGETPAQEQVCESESGAAFGLCNAFCEAMDCDSDAPDASDTACLKVQDKWIMITGRPALPCEKTCPCADDYSRVDFSHAALPVNCVDDPIETRLFDANSGLPHLLRVSKVVPDNTSCTAIDFSGAHGDFFDIDNLFLDDAEAEACRQLILQRASDLGVPCT